MNEITFTIDKMDVCASNQLMIDQFNERLKSLGVSLSIIGSESNYSLKINYDTDRIDKAMSRNAGRPRIIPNDYVSPAEIRRRMKTESADSIAESLGISRSTLFRKLKKAEETGIQFLF